MRTKYRPHFNLSLSLGGNTKIWKQRQKCEITFPFFVDDSDVKRISSRYCCLSFFLFFFFSCCYVCVCVCFSLFFVNCCSFVFRLFGALFLTIFLFNIFVFPFDFSTFFCFFLVLYIYSIFSRDSAGGVYVYAFGNPIISLI